MDWRKILVPPEFAADDPERGPPDGAREATTTDGRTLQALWWGRATQGSPMAILARISPKKVRVPVTPASQGVWKTSWRHPTVEELQDMIDTVAPEGCVFMALGLASRGPGAPSTLEELPPQAEWLGLTLLQTGILGGSPASRRARIIS